MSRTDANYLTSICSWIWFVHVCSLTHLPFQSILHLNMLNIDTRTMHHVLNKNSTVLLPYVHYSMHHCIFLNTVLSHPHLYHHCPACTYTWLCCITEACTRPVSIHPCVFQLDHATWPFLNWFSTLTCSWIWLELYLITLAWNWDVPFLNLCWKCCVESHALVLLEHCLYLPCMCAPMLDVEMHLNST